MTSFSKRSRQRNAADSRYVRLATVLLAATFTVSASAQPTTPSDRPARPDNYYAAGNRVEVTTSKSGDVVVAARQIEIAQPVGGDILAAGWRVALSARADDDVRIAGAEVSVNAPVAGDLTAAGGDVTL